MTDDNPKHLEGTEDIDNAHELHEHVKDGQSLVHTHPGGDTPHGYFEHAEDPGAQEAREIRTITERPVTDTDDGGRVICTTQEASPWAVREVLESPVGEGDGRSEWLWMRLPNGDLILGCFPEGETYFSTEPDRKV